MNAIVGTAPWWLILAALAVSEVHGKLRDRRRVRPAPGPEAARFAAWLLEQQSRASTGGHA